MRRARPWGIHAAAPPHYYSVGPILSQALAPFQSVTRASPQAIALDSHPVADPPLPRFFPLQRLSSLAEPPTSGGSQTVRLCCALRVSHPLDALLPARPVGLVSSRSRSWGSPFEALIRLWRRTFFRTPGPSWGWVDSLTHPPLQGFAHAIGSPPAGPAVTPDGCVACLLGLSPLQGILSAVAGEPCTAYLPLTRFPRPKRTLFGRWRPRVCTSHRRNRSLSRPI